MEEKQSKQEKSKQEKSQDVEKGREVVDTAQEIEETSQDLPTVPEELSMLDPEDIAENPMLGTTPGTIRKLDSDVFGLLQNLVCAMCVVVLLFTFVCPATNVSGESMEPTLYDKETLIVWSLFSYKPEIHDIIIISDPTVARLGGSSIVKRVIATEGQTVMVDYENSQVIVDGSPLAEPFIKEQMIPIYGIQTEPLVVPENCVFVLGDNRNRSSDSRDSDIGMVNLGYVKGEVLCRVWPLSAFTWF